jgi:hypothetical protein
MFKNPRKVSEFHVEKDSENVPPNEGLIGTSATTRRWHVMPLQFD